MRNENGRYQIPAQAHEPRFELDCSCGYGLDAPERLFDYMTERHAAAHSKGVDGLAASAAWDIRHIAADQPAEVMFGPCDRLEAEPGPDEPVPFTLTSQAEAALDAAEPEPEAEP
jgi:hypothetical protein